MRVYRGWLRCIGDISAAFGRKCRFLVFDFDNHEKGAEKTDFANMDDEWHDEVEHNTAGGTVEIRKRRVYMDFFQKADTCISCKKFWLPFAG